eukprot:4310694-Pyramimonas_sp.AAC.1
MAARTSATSAILLLAFEGVVHTLGQGSQDHRRLRSVKAERPHERTHIKAPLPDPHLYVLKLVQRLVFVGSVSRLTRCLRRAVGVGSSRGAVGQQRQGR